MHANASGVTREGTRTALLANQHLDAASITLRRLQDRNSQSKERRAGDPWFANSDYPP